MEETPRAKTMQQKHGDAKSKHGFTRSRYSEDIQELRIHYSVLMLEHVNTIRAW